MKKILFLLFVFTLGMNQLWAQFGCGNGVVITNGYTASNITTPGDGGVEDWVDSAEPVSISNYYFDDDVYLFQYTATGNEVISMTIYTRNSWTGIAVFGSCNGSSLTQGMGTDGSTTSSDVSITASANLAPGQTVYIAVGQWGTPNDLDFDVTSFSVAALNEVPPCATVTNPTNNSIGAALKPAIKWTTVPSTSGYKINLGTTSGGTDVLNNVDAGNVTSYSLTTALLPETTYYLSVIPYNPVGDATGCTETTFTTGQIPANDECSGAVNLTVNPDLDCGTVTSGTTVNATQSTNEDVCYGNPDDDVWYKFTATATSHVISIKNIVSAGSESTTDAYFQVLSGSCDNLTSILCSDPNVNTVTGLTIGETYYVRVYTYGGEGNNINFDICVGTLPPPPANDVCAGAVSLTPAGNFDAGAIVVNNSSASSTSTGTYSCLYSPTNTSADLWFTVVVPASGNITIETDSVADSPFDDSVLAVYSGSCDTLAFLECDDDDGNSSFSKISLTGQTPGTTLYISAAQYGTDITERGEFKISAYDSSLGVEDINNNANNITLIYPNPVKDVLFVKAPKAVKETKVYSLSGELLKTSLNSESINVSKFNKGTYIISIVLEDGSKVSKKFIKN